MTSRPLLLAGCWYVQLARHADNRGWFREAFSEQSLRNETGAVFDVAQINVSHSLTGVIRGVHYSIATPGQAKYVQCLQGAILDIIVDLRQGSSTFGRHQSVSLSEAEPSAVLIAEGVGHAFAVTDGPALVMYATSATYDAASEMAINPLDPALGLPWPFGSNVVLSERDKHAPSLEQVIGTGRLPTLTL